MFAATKCGATTLTLAFYASASSQASTVTVPAGVTTGDLLVLFDAAYETGVTPYTTFPTAVLPSGFTSILNVTNSYTSGSNTYNIRRIVSYFIATSDIGGTSITGMNGGGDEAKALLCSKPSGGIISVTSNGLQYQADTGVTDPAAQTITAASGNVPLVALGFASGSITASPAYDGVVSNTSGGIPVYACYKVYNNAPQNVTVNTGSASGAFLASCYFSIT